MAHSSFQNAILNFIKTVECQRYIEKKPIKAYVASRSGEKYSNKNLENVWSSCNVHFNSGIYIYLHKYQKLIKDNFSEDIALSSIEIIEKNTDKLFKLYKKYDSREQFLDDYKSDALAGKLDLLVSDKVF